MSDLPIWLTAPTAAFGSLSALTAALSAGWNWLSQAQASQHMIAVQRNQEVLRLLGDFQQVEAEGFMTFFDYDSTRDAALRVQDLDFTIDEVAMRNTVDRCFEHLRGVHRSVRLRLIQPEDLAPWVYWIHRVETRQPLLDYSLACGHAAFMRDLAQWTANSSVLAELRRPGRCPWWPPAGTFDGSVYE